MTPEAPPEGRRYWAPYIHPVRRPTVGNSHRPTLPRPAVDRTAESLAWILAERRRRYGSSPKPEAAP